MSRQPYPDKYPSKYESEAVLKDGSRIFLRPVQQNDSGKWLDFMSRMKRHKEFIRLHNIPEEMTEKYAASCCSIDYYNNFIFVALAVKKRKQEIVGLGRYYRLPQKNSADVFFLVDEDFQNKGIGTAIMELLVDAARDNGIRSFEAMIPENNNAEIVKAFNSYGFHLERKLEEGLSRITFSIAPTLRIAEKELERERLAAVASLNPVLSPRSVAIIGASRKESSIGQIVVQCIMDSKFSGVIYPVNPNAESILTVKTYPSVLDIPGNVDMAIIVVPAAIVPGVVEQCGQKGVRALVIISDGFRESGSEGAEREQRVRDISLGYGMRVVGPNCMGVINTDRKVRFNGTFATQYPPPGNIAFLSQSGALGLAMLGYASQTGTGLSDFISIGNRADISSNDLLEYWEQDKSTRAILLYLESFGNPHRFSRIARRVSRSKPVVAIKGGRTSAGSRAAATHTGAMASSNIAIEALFKQSGIIPANTLEEAFHVVSLLSKQPVPAGNRVAILTNGGGPGIIAADACERYGLELPQFSAKTAGQLKSASRRDITVNNPLDLTASASIEEFEKALEILAADTGNDAVIFISIPPILMDTTTIEEAIRRASPHFKKNNKPLVACFIGQPEIRSNKKTTGVPVYIFPEEAVLALSHATEYGAWLKKPEGKVPVFSGIKRSKAENIIKKAMTGTAQRPFWLPTIEAKELLNCYGINVAATAFAATADDAADKAEEIGFPVAVKLASDTIAHKTEFGGIVLGLKNKKEVKEAFITIQKRLAAKKRQKEMQGVVVQSMVKGGVEIITGMTEDPTFGPLIMFGMGGIYTELLKDVSVRLHPVTDLQAAEMVDSLKMSALLKGWRDMPRSDTRALQDMLLRLSALIEDMKMISEIDLNPVIALPEGEGYSVVDVKIRLK